MTVYSGENPIFFQQSLMSMVNQSLKPDEIVLVKDGIIPKSIQIIIDEVNNLTNGLIKEIQIENNVGLGLALNEGLKACKNELIARMDSDDISLPKRCERQIKEFEQNTSLDIVGCPVYEFIDSIENVVGIRKVPLTKDLVKKYVRRRDPFNHPTVMYKKSKLLEVGCYKNLRKNQDTDLWLRMLNNGYVGINIPEILYYFRFNENTYKKRKNWINTKSLLSIRYKAFKLKYCSLLDFGIVAISQLCIFILPAKIQKIIYRKFLRK